MWTCRGQRKGRRKETDVNAEKEGLGEVGKGNAPKVTQAQPPTSRHRSIDLVPAATPQRPTYGVHTTGKQPSLLNAASAPWLLLRGGGPRARPLPRACPLPREGTSSLDEHQALHSQEHARPALQRWGPGVPSGRSLSPTALENGGFSAPIPSGGEAGSTQ